jgi:hypothetical protein
MARRLPNDPQRDLFRAPLAPAVPIPSEFSRPPTALRAGTRIDHAGGNAIEIRCRQPLTGRTSLAGWLDRRQRVFQSGGRLREFCFFKERLHSLPSDVWEELTTRWADAIDVIELVDYEASRVYRVAFTVARDQGRWYQAGIGPRWGVPTALWDVETESEP